MSAKHTPGPWYFGRMRITPRDKDRRCGFVVNGPERDGLDLRICDLRVHQGVSGYGESEADARLIAAAPELLAALRGALRELVTPKGLPEVGKGRTTAQQAALDDARAAIAKAGGAA